MGDARLVTLLSTNHSQDLLQGMWNCFLDKYKVDIEIICNGHSLKAHQLLLAALCPWLKEPLNSVGVGPTFKNDGKECTLNLDHVTNDGSDMNFLIEFMYRGRTTVPEDRLENLRRAAQTLGVQGLVNAIRDLKAGVTATDNRDNDAAIGGTFHDRTLEPADHRHYRNNHTKEANNRSSSDRRKRKRPPVKLQEVAYNSQEYGLVSEEETMDSSWTRRYFYTNDHADSDDDAEMAEEEDDEELERVATNREMLECSRQDHHLHKSREKDNYYSETAAASADNPQGRRRVVSGSSKMSRSEYKRLWRLSRPLQKCSYCDYETRDKVCFASHVAKHDPTAERFVCDVCQKTFRSKKGFNYHQRSHLGPEQLHKCFMCDFYTPVKSTWMQHLAVKHKVDKDGNLLTESFKCSICNYVCVTDSKLKEHVKRKHTLVKSYDYGRTVWKTDSHQRHVLSRHAVAQFQSASLKYSHPDSLNLTCKNSSNSESQPMEPAEEQPNQTARNAVQAHLVQSVLVAKLNPRVLMEVKEETIMENCEMNDDKHNDECRQKLVKVGDCDCNSYVCHICGRICETKTIYQAHFQEMHCRSSINAIDDFNTASLQKVTSMDYPGRRNKQRC